MTTPVCGTALLPSRSSKSKAIGVVRGICIGYCDGLVWFYGTLQIIATFVFTLKQVQRLSHLQRRKAKPREIR